MKDYIHILSWSFQGMQDRSAILLVLIVNLAVILFEEAVNDLYKTFLTCDH